MHNAATDTLSIELTRKEKRVIYAAIIIGSFLIALLIADRAYHWVYPGPQFLRSSSAPVPDMATRDFRAFFPLGSDTAPLLSYLEEEAFRSVSGTSGFNQVELRLPRLFCADFVYVTWAADAHNRLTDLRASTSTECR